MFLYKPANSRIHTLSIKALKKYAQASLMAIWHNRYVTENVNEFNLISRRSDSTFTKSLNIEIKKISPCLPQMRWKDHGNEYGPVITLLVSQRNWLRAVVCQRNLNFPKYSSNSSKLLFSVIMIRFIVCVLSAIISFFKHRRAALSEYE